MNINHLEKTNKFFIIGAMKCGTTYTCAILDEHPEIYVAKPYLKEPKFFIMDDEYSKGLDFYESKYFPADKKINIYGEKTVHYCEHEKAAKRINESYPNSKIIMILRNPTHRAISNYFFSKKNSLETRSLEEVFLDKIPAPEYDIEKFFISPFDYLERGIYINHIKMFEKYFDKKNFKILIMENYAGNMKKIKELYTFLGVDDKFKPESIHEKIHSNEEDATKVNPHIITELNEYFYDYNKLLEKHLGISLKIWE